MNDQPEGRALTMPEINAKLRANRCSPACAEQHTYEPPCQAGLFATAAWVASEAASPIPAETQASRDKALCGYCPQCGRGDAGPTADEYEQLRQRLARSDARECPCPPSCTCCTPTAKTPGQSGLGLIRASITARERKADDAHDAGNHRTSNEHNAIATGLRIAEAHILANPDAELEASQRRAVALVERIDAARAWARHNLTAEQTDQLFAVLRGDQAKETP
ncbi:hypothetical protein ACIQU4_15440 [Streptomyces sp. NPDC090741]|uniref:hypothetical protein n=1 Tax=Streptomyces sp. NPDC090741 TaxID=3365967 RepID=UPI0037F2496D